MYFCAHVCVVCVSVCVIYISVCMTRLCVSVCACVSVYEYLCHCVCHCTYVSVNDTCLCVTGASHPSGGPTGSLDRTIGGSLSPEAGWEFNLSWGQAEMGAGHCLQSWRGKVVSGAERLLQGPGGWNQL
jgi:hypothetical protein